MKWAIGIVAAVVGLAACGSGAPASKGSSLSSWWAAHHAPYTAVQRDMEVVGAAADPSTDCQRLESDTQSALGAPAAPVPSVAKHLAAGMADAHAAASDCLAGLQDGNSALIQRAASEVNEANTQINRATAAIKAAS